MEMCYDGTLVMPSNYAVMDEDDMMYVDGGGTLTITLKKSTIQAAIGAIAGIASGIAITAALDSVGIRIAAAIEVGTAGAATLAVGAFLVAWHGWAAGIAAGIATTIIGSGAGKLYTGGDKKFSVQNKYIKPMSFNW